MQNKESFSFATAAPVGGMLTSSASVVATRGHDARAAMDGMDVEYLKNVLLKFLEAEYLGRVAERDALLPVVGTLL